MNTDRTDVPSSLPAGEAVGLAPRQIDPSNGDTATWQAECERLRQAIQGLQAQCEHERERVADLQRERDEYRQLVHALAGALFTEEELTSIPAEGDCLSLTEFVAELEAVVRKP